MIRPPLALFLVQMEVYINVRQRRESEVLIKLLQLQKPKYAPPSQGTGNEQKDNTVEERGI